MMGDLVAQWYHMLYPSLSKIVAMEWDAGMLQVAQHNHIQIRFGLVLFVLSLRRFGMFGIRFASNLDFDAFMRESHALPASSTWRLTTSCLRSSGLDLWPCRWRQSKWSHPERSSTTKPHPFLEFWNPFSIVFLFSLYFPMILVCEMPSPTVFGLRHVYVTALDHLSFNWSCDQGAYSDKEW